MMKKVTIISLSLLILFGGIWLSDTLGIWATESSKNAMLNKEGLTDPGDIRGSYSLMDIERNFGVSVEQLSKAFQLPTDGQFQVKDLESRYDMLQINGETVEIGTTSMRYFVFLISGHSSESVVPTWLPSPAVDMLEEEGYIVKGSLENWRVQLEIATNEETLEVEPLIKGKTTVQEVLNLGLSLESIEEILGMKIDDKSSIIRDLCISNNLEFSTVKERLQLLYDGNY